MRSDYEAITEPSGQTVRPSVSFRDGFSYLPNLYTCIKVIIRYVLSFGETSDVKRAMRQLVLSLTSLIHLVATRECFWGILELPNCTCTS